MTVDALLILIRKLEVRLAAMMATGGSPPAAHASTHQNGGADEVNVAGLSGLLADPQTPLGHHASHENGGSDEINVAGLSGVLADPQTVDVDPAGALDGDGSVGSPLAVKVDGVTIQVNGSNELEVIGGGSGTGDVVGPGSATDNAIARFDGTTGKLLQDSAPLVEDDGRLSTVTDPTGLQDAATKNYVDTQLAALNAGGAAQNTFLVSGGQVVWITAYQFVVSAATYYINGVLYSSPESTITLDAADATLDRIDIIAVDDSETVIKITGTAASQPAEPDVDPATQLKLAIVFVAAASSAPASATSVTVYAEDAGASAEWNWTSSGSGWTLASTNNPRSGTKDIEATNISSGAYIQGEKGSGTLDPNLYDQLVFYIRSKASWANNRSMQLRLQNAGVVVGQTITIANGQYGFDSSNASSYQQIAIPLTAFAVPAGMLVNQVRLTRAGPSTIGFYLDDMSWVATGATQTQTGITQAQADARYAPLSPSFVTLGTNPTLPNERVLTASARVSVTDAGAGSTVTLDVPNDAIDNARMANMAQATIKGRAASAGTGDPTDLTPDQVSAVLDGATDPFLRTSAGGSGYSDEQAQDAVGTILVDTASIDLTYDDVTPKITADVKTAGVTSAMLRDSAAVSVIGRSANSTGVPADIAASADGQVLRRAVGAVGFGALDLADSDAVTGVLPLANVGARTGVFGWLIDGGSAPFATGFAGVTPPMPFAGTITKITMLSCDAGSPVSSSATFDLWRDTYANYIPTVADTIIDTGAGGVKPAVSSAIKNQVTSFSHITTAFSAGDVFALNVDANTAFRRMLFAVEYTTP